MRRVTEVLAGEVLDFWFGKPGTPEYGTQRRDWFAKDPAFDAAVRARFLATHARAAAGELADWEENAASALALVIVLDQFPHHLFRGDARAFATDAAALAAADRALARGFDAEVLPVQRIFFYLPLEHAEDLACQDRAVERFARLAETDPAFSGALDYAHRHREVILKFGRFPHRNAALGRTSTPEELDYLATPGAGF